MRKGRMRPTCEQTNCVAVPKSCVWSNLKHRRVAAPMCDAGKAEEDIDLDVYALSTMLLQTVHLQQSPKAHAPGGRQREKTHR